MVLAAIIMGAVFAPAGARGVRGVPRGPASPSARERDLLPQHVANTTAMAAADSRLRSVVRDGFAAPGDGPAIRYDHGAASCPHPDGGAQIAASAGGCWVADLPRELDPRIWGADASGERDSTAPIQAAMDFAVRYSFASIRLSVGRFKLSSALRVGGAAASGLDVGGAGQSRTTLVLTEEDQDGIVLGDARPGPCCDGGKDFRVHDLSVTTTVAKTGGAAVLISRTYNSEVSRISTIGMFAGIRTSASSVSKIYDNSLSSATAGIGAGIVLDSDDVAAFIAHNNADNDSNPFAGLKISGSVQGSYIHHNNFAHAVHPLWVSTAGERGAKIENMFFTQNSYDFASSENLIACDDASGTGAHIVRFNMLGEWYATSRGASGLSVQGKACEISDLRWEGPQFYNNVHHGVVIGGTVVDWSMTNPRASGNGGSSPGEYHGLLIETGVSHWSIMGGSSKQMSNFTNIQGYGVVVQPGASDYYRISGMDNSINMSGSILDGGTGTHKWAPTTGPEANF